MQQSGIGNRDDGNIRSDEFGSEIRNGTRIDGEYFQLINIEMLEL